MKKGFFILVSVVFCLVGCSKNNNSITNANTQGDNAVVSNYSKNQGDSENNGAISSFNSADNNNSLKVITANDDCFSSIDEIKATSSNPFPLYILRQDGKFYSLQKTDKKIYCLDDITKKSDVFLAESDAYLNIDCPNVIHCEKGDKLITLSQQSLPSFALMTEIDYYYSPIVFTSVFSYGSELSSYRNYDTGKSYPGPKIEEINGKSVSISSMGALEDFERYINEDNLYFTVLENDVANAWIALVHGNNDNTPFSFGYYDDVSFITEQSDLSYALMHFSYPQKSEILQPTKNGYFIVDLENYKNTKIDSSTSGYYIIRNNNDDVEYILLCEP